MLKQILGMVLLSLIVILAMPYAHAGLQLLLSVHHRFSYALADVFSGGASGKMVRELICLVIPPLLFSTVPALVYWVAKRSWFPYFIHCVWILWIIQTSALLAYNMSL